jgi:hypothetical protein
MCHRHIHVALSAKDKKDVKKLSGIMIPIYTTAMLALVAFVMVAGTARQGEMIASSTASAVAR